MRRARCSTDGLIAATVVMPAYAAPDAVERHAGHCCLYTYTDGRFTRKRSGPNTNETADMAGLLAGLLLGSPSHPARFQVPAARQACALLHLTASIRTQQQEYSSNMADTLRSPSLAGIVSDPSDPSRRIVPPSLRPDGS